MLNLNLLKGINKPKPKWGGITLLELLTYSGAAIYYLFGFSFMLTVIIAGWKYILS